MLPTRMTKSDFAPASGSEEGHLATIAALTQFECEVVNIWLAGWHFVVLLLVRNLRATVTECVRSSAFLGRSVGYLEKLWEES